MTCSLIFDRLRLDGFLFGHPGYFSARRCEGKGHRLLNCAIEQTPALRDEG